MVDKVKNLILVGCGKRGLGHLRAMEKFNKVPDIFCDFNPKSLENLNNTHRNSDFYTDLESLNKLINKSSKYYAVIAVDAKSNYKVAKTLLEKGINVLMEKPPGLSTNEAEKLIDISKDLNLDCFIGFDRRFNPYVAKSIEIIKDYGEIFNLQAEFNKDINEWIGHRAFDENVLDKMVLESPIHSIDLINYLSSSSIKNVNGFSRRIGSKYRTSFCALIEYENGASGTINSSYLTSGRLEKYSIHAKNCSIYLDGINSGKIFYKSRIYEMEISEELTSTEIQMKNYLEYVYDDKKFNGAKIEESLNIFRITEKMFDNTFN